MKRVEGVSKDEHGGERTAEAGQCLADHVNCPVSAVVRPQARHEESNGAENTGQDEEPELVFRLGNTVVATRPIDREFVGEDTPNIALAVS